LHGTRTAETIARWEGPDRPANRFPHGVDLGLDAPIEADGRRHTRLDHRRVSFRWLSGTALVGVAGAALIGAAVYAALDRESIFAEAPELAPGSHRDVAVSDFVNPHKGDRIVKPIDIVAAKQSFRAPTTVKVGDKEVVKVRAFTRVATPLTLSTAGYADDVPPFNPLKLLAGGPSQDSLPDVVQAPDDAAVAFQTRDLAADASPIADARLSLEEIQAQVAEHVKNALAAGARAPLPLPPQLLLMRTSRAGVEPAGGLAYANPNAPVMSAPFSSIQVRMVPENVSVISKSPPLAPGRAPPEKLVIVRHGESLQDILNANGVPKQTVERIVAAFGPVRRGEPLVREGQKLRMLFLDLEGSDKPTLARLSVYTDETLEETIALDDRGDYLQVAKAELQAKQKRGKHDDDDDGMRLYDSFYETALKQEIPQGIIDDLVRIFANDVDFQRPVAGGDSFEVFYEDSEEDPTQHELLYASITVRNETFKYYRFQTPDDGVVDFYDENGKSTRKFLIRQPVGAARITSPFGRRYHPILGYTRMHTGVDFGAHAGTPIVAAGNGVVIKAGRESGYGNRVEIQHANGYITTYNHMSGFARGIVEGTRVKQGQVIGYLGMTGLATGPHLHYEVIVNGHFVDPMRVKLARTRELDRRMLQSFRRERDRIDGLIAKAPNATATAQVAAAKSKR
jgi:murein DD-endopeptidase MepM/ murein hydrolase activator NlpD